jgi:hypothetical protein
LTVDAEEDMEETEEDDDDEVGDVVDPSDLELNIELTMVLGTSHLSFV